MILPFLTIYHFSNRFLEAMTFKFIIFGLLNLFLCLFLWYYIVIFCGVYTSSYPNWLISVAISLIIDWIIVSFLLYILLSACVRSLMKNIP